MYTMFQYYTDSARIDQDRREKVQRAQIERELHVDRVSHNRTSMFAARVFGLIASTGPEQAATKLDTTAI